MALQAKKGLGIPVSGNLETAANTELSSAEFAVDGEFFFAGVTADEAA